jgi:hypothetical protein
MAKGSGVEQKQPWDGVDPKEITEHVFIDGNRGGYAYITQLVPVNAEFGSNPNEITLVRVHRENNFTVCHRHSNVTISVINDLNKHPKVQKVPFGRTARFEDVPPKRLPAQLILEDQNEDREIRALLTLDTCHRLVRLLNQVIESHS